MPISETANPDRTPGMIGHDMLDISIQMSDYVRSFPPRTTYDEAHR